MANISPVQLGLSGFVSCPIVGMVFAGTTGFQSPADDYAQDRIDLAKELVTNEANVFCYRVCGDSFKAAGIPDGSVAVIDYSEKPKTNDIVLVILGDVMSLKILKFSNGRRFLASATEGYPTIPIDAEEGIHVLGVLKHCVLSF